MGTSPTDDETRSVHESRSDPVQEAAQFWDKQHADPSDIRYWLELPAIIVRVNQRITGHPAAYPLTAFLQLVKEATTVAGKALSIDCGVGHLERQVIRENGAGVIDGIDPSPRSTESARASAETERFSDRIRYHCTDVVSWLEDHPDAAYDLVFFHGSLHHIEALEQVLEWCAGCLRGGDPGWMFVDEYIGPSRDEWTDEHLEPARRMFAKVPEEHRRTPVLWPPIAWEDPTEMIRSSEIVGVVRDYFEMIHYRPYYGNVLQSLISGIKGSALDDPAIVALVDEAIALEHELIEQGAIEPLYAAFAARPLR